jgi:hypothetical protein
MSGPSPISAPALLGHFSARHHHFDEWLLRQPDGASQRADWVGSHGSRDAETGLGARQNPADTFLENVLRGQQTDHQERLPFKIKEEAGLDEYAVIC